MGHTQNLEAFLFIRTTVVLGVNNQVNDFWGAGLKITPQATNSEDLQLVI
jgi:hypothetical protein